MQKYVFSFEGVGNYVKHRCKTYCINAHNWVIIPVCRASLSKDIRRWRVGLTHAAVKSPVWPIRARSTFFQLGEKKHMSKLLARLTTTLLADVKNAHLLLSTGVQKMPVTVSTADGVTVLTLTSDPNSSCPPLCQILKGLCYSPRCCTMSQQLKENQGISHSTLGVSVLDFQIGLQKVDWLLQNP